MTQTNQLKAHQSGVMQGSINNHIDLLKAILSAEEAKNYNEALSKLYKSDNAIVQHIRMI